MESGAEALKRMQEIDQNSGIVPPEVKRQAEKEYKQQQSQPLQANSSQALDDKSLANNMLAQAQRMESEARGMIAEAARMKKEAEKMYPGVNTKEAAPVATASPAPTKRGRPSKKVAADAAVQ